MLSTGTRLGSYVVVEPIGAGAMGQVYRARDARLNRDVAIKVLPEPFASDVDRVARFRREAQALAALNHPHIAQIYGVEEADGTHALVMELVEGETIADRLTRGPLPTNEALHVARQIADALAAAHEAGLIHRDLKPANIRLRPDGTIKVLDFGLAKAVQRDGSSPDVTVAAASAVTSPDVTQHGVILGTAAYMSPEQATGKPVDRRSDIWAFGCVLFEILTATRTFPGESVTETIAAVIRGEPEWRALPADVPESIRRLLTRCLQKDPKKRLSDLSDARLEIDDALHAPHSVASAALPPHEVTPAWRSVLPWAIAAMGIIAALMLAWQRPAAPPAAPQQSIRLAAALGAPVVLVTAQGPAVVLSRDGSMLAFVAQPRTTSGVPQLYVRRLDQLSAQALPGTEGAINPFFSPDGQWIGFFSGGKLRKIAAAAGSAPIMLTDAPNGRGGSWADDDHIFFMPDLYAGIWRVAASGGSATRVSTPEGPMGTHRWPDALPGGKAVLYTALGMTMGYENADLVLQPLDGGAPRVVQRNAFYGQYVAGGHLLFLRNGTLMAAPFDLERLETTGEPTPFVQDLAQDGFWTGAAQFSASDNGRLAYLPASIADAPIVWLDERGNSTALRATPANWSDPAFSPDGGQLAMNVSDGKQSDIWIYDWARDAMSRLTLDAAADFKPVWSPKGTQIAFSSSRGGPGTLQIYLQRADGTGQATQLTKGRLPQAPVSWHPSGKFLAFMEASAETGFDVMILPLEGSDAAGWTAGTPIPFVKTTAAELEPNFSRDGKWLAYFSNESGRPEVYVRPFPGPGRVWQVSQGGGTFPIWSASAQELIYTTLDQRLMVVPYTVEAGAFHASTPREWPESRHQVRGPLLTRSFALHPDGRRIAAAPIAAAGALQTDSVILALDAGDELRRLTQPPRQ